MRIIGKALAALAIISLVLQEDAKSLKTRLLPALAVLTVIFLVMAVSIGCARRPGPQPGPTATPAPVVEEKAPAVTVEEKPPSRVEEVPTPSRMLEEGVARTEEAEAATVSELRDIHFDFDKYDIRPDTRPILERNAKWIREHPGGKIQIEGHCDQRGTVEYNLALGDRRAKAARDYLISLGIDPKQLSTVSFGEEMPLDPGHNEEAWAKNRRTHFVLLK